MPQNSDLHACSNSPPCDWTGDKIYVFQYKDKAMTD